MKDVSVQQDVVPLAIVRPVEGVNDHKPLTHDECNKVTVHSQVVYPPKKSTEKDGHLGTFENSCSILGYNDRQLDHVYLILVTFIITCD